LSCPAHARRQGCYPRSRRTRSKWPTSCKPARQWPTSGHLAYRKADAAGRVGWAASAAQRSNPAPDHAARADELAAAAERLRTALIENLPATRIIAKYGLPNAVLYVDPPYLETVRTGRHAHAAGTAHGTASDDEHRELADALRPTRATVVRGRNSRAPDLV